MLKIGTTMRSDCLGNGEISEVMNSSDGEVYSLRYLWCNSLSDYAMSVQGTLEDLESYGWKQLR